MVIRQRDFQNSIPSRNAINAPVQAPLPGSGTITKIMRKISPQTMNLWACLECVFLKSFSKKLSNHLECLRNRFEIGPRSFRMMIATKILPRIAQIQAWYGSIPSTPTAYGIPPLSSVRGSIESRNVSSSLGIFFVSTK